jgi:DNA repair protein RadD
MFEAAASGVLMPSAFESRWYQAEAEQSIFDYFEARRGKPGNPVVALPTGTGKSVVIANFLRSVYRMFPGQRVMMLTHVKELIEQNAAKLMQVWPTAPLGIYSAGLGQKNAMLPITFGGVLSVKNVVRLFGHIDILLIDECHLLSPEDDTSYQAIIAELLAINPWLRVIGFTATPFRMKQGMITDGGIFTDICYDQTGVDAFNRLVAEGFICPLIAKRTDATIDLSNVGVNGGEYQQGAAAQAADEITQAAVAEMVAFGESRRSWLTFAGSVEHAEHVAEEMQSRGINAAASHSKLSNKENTQRLKDFKRGELRALINMGKYTTGMDHPPIDLIGMLRATLSPGLWVQMLGRGTRPFAGNEFFPGPKSNCLVLDFARNSVRLGPINDPVIPRKPGKGGGDAPIRICEEGYRTINGQRRAYADGCGGYNHPKVKFCDNCGMEFEFESKLLKTAGTEDVMRIDTAPIVEYFDVKRVLYNLHRKEGSPDMIRVSYICGFQMFNEFVCLEHPKVRWRAKEWWRCRHHEDPPETTAEALYRASELRQPTRVRVHVNKKHPQVIGYEF